VFGAFAILISFFASSMRPPTLSTIGEALSLKVSSSHVEYFEKALTGLLLKKFSAPCANFSPSLRLNNSLVLAIKASNSFLFHLSHLASNSFIIEFANTLRSTPLFCLISSIILFASSFFASNSLFIKSSSF
jgi:hypothetical protein